MFPSHYHIKVSVSGCPNDCGKGHFNDFGIMVSRRWSIIQKDVLAVVLVCELVNIMRLEYFH
ncbi:MAG: hypothetical protein ACLRQF_03605 [Thomasclavelia ramosa]